jgi:hypothetical protein
MKPCDYSKNIQPATNPETGQQEFKDPQHPLARKDGMVMLSRHLMSMQLGRWLRSFEIVIYKDGNSQNLAIENLALTTIGKLSHSPQHNAVTLVCHYCGAPFKVTPSHKNRRIYHSEACRRLAEQKFVIDPEELRQLVWEIPTTQIACLYGVSDKAVEKRCRALGISKPPRGYWAKHEQDLALLEEGE